MFTALKNGILSADNMSFSPHLLIEGNSSYRTLTGGLVSISLFVLSIIGTVYFGQDLWIKSKSNVVVSAVNNINVGPFEINEKVFNVYFGLQLSDGLFYVDPTISYFSGLIQSNQVLPNGTNVLTTTSLDMGLCNKYYKTSDEISIDFSVDIDTFYCMKPNVTYISGFWGEPINYMAHIYLNKCTNYTGSDVTCKSQEEIDNTIQGGIITMYAINYNIDMNNYTNPIQPNLQDVWTSLNVDLTFMMVYTLQANSFSTDVGLFFEDFETINYPYFDTPSILYYGPRGNIICDFTIEGTQQGSSATRTYIKIQDVVTKIGGMIKALSLLAQALSYISSKIEFLNDFIFNTKYKLQNSISNEIITSNNLMTNNFLRQKPNEIVEISKNNEISPSEKNDKKYSISQNKKVNVVVIDNNLDISTCKLNTAKNSANIAIIGSKKQNILISRSNNFYKNKATDFMSQLFYFMKCNTELTKQRANIDRKINKILSVDFLLYKFFLLELMYKTTLEKKQESINIEQVYLQQLIDQSSESNLEAFNIPSKILD